MSKQKDKKTMQAIWVYSIGMLVTLAIFVFVLVSFVRHDIQRNTEELNTTGYYKYPERRITPQ